MIKEYVVKITDDVIPDGFARFEDEYSPELELVRCKDCWKREFDNCPFNEFSEFYKPDDDFFCADGERRGKNDG